MFNWEIEFMTFSGFLKFGEVKRKGRAPLALALGDEVKQQNYSKLLGMEKLNEFAAKLNKKVFFSCL